MGHGGWGGGRRGAREPKQAPKSRKKRLYYGLHKGLFGLPPPSAPPAPMIGTQFHETRRDDTEVMTPQGQRRGGRVTKPIVALLRFGSRMCGGKLRLNPCPFCSVWLGFDGLKLVVVVGFQYLPASFSRRTRADPYRKAQGPRFYIFRAPFSCLRLEESKPGDWRRGNPGHKYQVLIHRLPGSAAIQPVGGSLGQLLGRGNTPSRKAKPRFGWNHPFPPIIIEVLGIGGSAKTYVIYIYI